MNSEQQSFHPNQYVRAKSIAEAVALLADKGSKALIIAGGTDILVDRNPQTEVLIDLMDAGLNFIRSEGSAIQIGAATPISGIEASSLLQQAPYSLLVQAAAVLGTPQIRNMATIGGNICRPSPCADTAPALLALDAVLKISGPAGERSLKVCEFFKNVKRDALDPGEILTTINLPAYSTGTAGAFIKQGRVAAADLALLSAAVRISLDTNYQLRDARIALGSAAPIPMRAREAEKLLLEDRLSPDLIEKAADRASEEIQPIDDLRCSAAHRKTLCRVLVTRALQQALGEAEAVQPSRQGDHHE
jgi:CO/xanthine dehydrogenase FAD-binding subunit